MAGVPISSVLSTVEPNFRSRLRLQRGSVKQGPVTLTLRPLVHIFTTLGFDYPRRMKSSELRWGQSSPSGVVEARSRLLDAAERCFDRDGLSATTMEAIAAEASVSRATLYRYYSGRDELILDTVLQEADRFYAKIRPRIDAAETLEAAILEFTLLMIRAARKDQFLTVLFSVDGAEHGGRMMSEGSVALFERVAMFLQPTFEKFSDELRPNLVADDAAEWILRAVFSFLIVPGPKRRSREMLGAYLREYLIPSLGNPESDLGHAQLDSQPGMCH